MPRFGVIMVRSGDEPIHARSPLRLRLTLALIGVVAGWGCALLFWVVRHQGMAALIAAAVGSLALVNVLVVARHLRTGPHYQPGRDVPPYHPVDAEPRRRPGDDPVTGRPRPVTPRTRQRRYLILMGICLFLITNAWVWVRLVSVPAAVVMSLVAAVIPPFAAIVANAGWSEQDRPPPEAPHDPRGR
jgi:hypothetical protein